MPYVDDTCQDSTMFIKFSMNVGQSYVMCMLYPTDGVQLIDN